MPKTTACVWCWRPITVSDEYNDSQHKGVCSPKCAQAETWFCHANSDARIGERNYVEHGVNPNNLGRKHGKKTR